MSKYHRKDFLILFLIEESNCSNIWNTPLQQINFHTIYKITANYTFHGYEIFYFIVLFLYHCFEIQLEINLNWKDFFFTFLSNGFLKYLHPPQKN